MVFLVYMNTDNKAYFFIYNFIFWKTIKNGLIFISNEIILFIHNPFFEITIKYAYLIICNLVNLFIDKISF